ncbi:MAG TPA: sialate O-acetylesterase [Edaphobacter sp.]|jgi:sialate O-acetylesterase|nr:sialate O-acetylesterase [Edaphobacter sp.]
MHFRLLLSLFAASLPLTFPAIAEVSLPKLFSSHMVLQRDMPIHVWGSAAEGERVTAEFHGLTASTTADHAGRWSLYLSSQSAGGPFTLVIRATNTIQFDDILLGDLWFASGQSNMEMPLAGFPGSAVVQNADQEIAAANYPDIRFFRIDRDVADYPLEDVKAATGWSRCTPETAKDFSAVAYFFARDLQKALGKQHVAIGLIDSTWGGTPAEAWTSLDTLGGDPALAPAFAARAEKMDHEATEIRLDQADKLAKEQGRAPTPNRDWHPNPASWRPAALYNAMVAPFTPLPIRGVIWYQGESNSSHAYFYNRIFPAMIQDWRRQWHQGNFPFLFVQISAFASTSKEDWGTLRDAQRRSLYLAKTGMAVTIDAGDEHNVHPANKQVVGERLSLLARQIVFGEDITASGPFFQLAYPSGSAMHVWFHNADGLRFKGDSLEGFEVAGHDGVFVAARAQIEGETVIVESSAVPNPKYVRYAWSNFPKANLYNGAGLPASTFTSFQPASIP